MVGLVALLLEVVAGVVAGGLTTFVHSRDVGRTDEELLGVIAFALFGAALLAIPLGAICGRRRRRRWMEAVVLQSTLVLASVIAVATSKHISAAVWPFLVAVAVLALLLAAPPPGRDSAPPKLGSSGELGG